ncbi:MAG: di-trans,poly-cis-decaprenylcistransferase [Clostridia bacterium]|nr:di-trans,poly-cis-decaprenylcistransferase [Clostridia bacterium]
MPRHIAFIMDGNGRWATKRALPRTSGHAQGGKTFRAIADACLDRDIEVITFFAFSTENWKRPKAEISALITLLNRYLLDWFSEERAKNTRIHFLGDTTPFSKDLRELISRAEKTGEDISHHLNIALNYGGRADITQAANAILKKRIAAGDATPITEEEIDLHLATANMPDVDLLIRTGGESRISNFLLWQSAYAELYFTETLWPDFSEEELDRAILWYRTRDRRFGGLTSN